MRQHAAMSFVEIVVEHHHLAETPSRKTRRCVTRYIPWPAPILGLGASLKAQRLRIAPSNAAPDSLINTKGHKIAKSTGVQLGVESDPLDTSGVIFRDPVHPRNCLTFGVHSSRKPKKGDWSSSEVGKCFRINETLLVGA